MKRLLHIVNIEASPALASDDDAIVYYTSDPVQTNLIRKTNRGDETIAAKTLVELIFETDSTIVW